MGQFSDPNTTVEVRCPICGMLFRLAAEHARHIRWTFDQGSPIAFAQFALETSPYLRGIGAQPRTIPDAWWESHGDWVVDRVLLHFDARDGYVFGDVAQLDRLARDIWKEFVEPAETVDDPPSAGGADA